MNNTQNLRNSFAQKPLRGLSLAILGAGGGMGRMLAREARRAGAEVMAFNRKPAKACMPFKAAVDFLPQTQVILSCLPETALGETLDSLRPYLHSNQVLADITSLKGQAMQTMAAAHPGPVVGAHPLFGPQASFSNSHSGIGNGLGRRVAIVPGARAVDNHVRQVENLFSGMGCKPFQCSSKEHDRAMAMMQGLNFLDQLAFLSIVSTVSRLNEFITPSFKRRLNAAKKFLTQDAELFLSLARDNPYVREMGDAFVDELRQVLHGNTAPALSRARNLFER